MVWPDMAGSRSGMFTGCLVVFGLSCLIFWVDTRVIRDAPAWSTFEFCQYAEIGKNLSLEGTYDTRLVEPMALAMIDHDRIGPPSNRWPIVNRYPLPSLAVAGCMKVMGPTDQAVAWSNGLAIGLLAVVTYAAARVWFGAVWASIAALLFLANPSFYGVFILLGTPDVWFAAIFVMELLVWSRFDPAEARFRPGWAVLVGVLGGLSYLSRFNASVFLVIQGLALLRHRRWREAALMTVSAAVVVTPILMDNVVHFGRPFVSIYSAWNLLDKIGAYRLEPWLYYRRPNLVEELGAHRAGFVQKFAENIFLTVPKGLWSLWRLEVLMPAAVAALWCSPRGSSFRRFTGWSISLFVVQLVLFSALRLEFEGRESAHNGRYFFWFAAPAVLLAVGTFARLSSGRRWVKGLAALAVIGQLTLFGMSWVPMVRGQSVAGLGFGRDIVRRMLAEVVRENRMIATNQPQITAWVCGLRSLSLPADFDELERINRESPTPADYLFIDLGFNPIQVDRGWYTILAQNPEYHSPWEQRLRESYDFVLPFDQTRTIGYMFLRRKGVPKSELELIQEREGPAPLR